MAGREKIPVDGKSNLLLRYRGKKHTFPYFSAADVLTGQVPTEKLRDKIVFVGTNALGTREVVATPLDTLFAGVEVQATVADNLLQGDFVRRPELGNATESYAAVIAGVAVALLVAGSGCRGARSASSGFWAGCGSAPCGCSRRPASSCRRCCRRSARSARSAS